MKVLVKGAGMYGCVIADILMGNGHEVMVSETAPEILMGASFKNFRRLHAGFHYPKSIKTALECSDGYETFLTRYGRFCKIMDSRYWIAGDSEVEWGEYLDFLYALGRDYEVVRAESDHVVAGIKCEEAVYDPYAMRRWFKKILPMGSFDPDMEIDCTYADSLLAETRRVTMLRIQADLPERAQTTLYGPFCGVIPAQEGGFFLYHAGTSDSDEMIRDAAKFFPKAIGARILDGQIIRHIRPHGEERPYVIQRSHEKRIHILSGKIGQSVACAEEVARLLANISAGPDTWSPATGFEAA